MREGKSSFEKKIPNAYHGGRNRLRKKFGSVYLQLFSYNRKSILQRMDDFCEEINSKPLKEPVTATAP